MKRRLIDVERKPDKNTLLLLHFDDNYHEEIENINASVYNGSNLSFLPGKFGKCLNDIKKNNTGGVVSVEKTVLLDYNNVISLDFWYSRINGASTDDNTSVRLGGSSISGRNSQFAINMNYQGYITLLVDTGNLSGWRIINTGITFPSGDFHHFYLNWNKSNIKFFINGLLKYDSNITLNKKGGEYTNIILNQGSKIDEFRLSDIIRWEQNFTPPTKPY